jgi:outer membrane immunogenic protein
VDQFVIRGFIPNTTASGGIFGGHAGHNWQYGPAVGGVEVDFDGADITSTSPSSSSRGLLRSAPRTSSSTRWRRSAAGSAMLWSNWLIYGTAGVGWGHTRIDTHFPLSPTSFSYSNSLNEFGWVAGVGVEYRLFEHILLRAEYLHYDFLQNTYGFQTPFVFPQIVNTNLTQRVDVIRGGITYKF